MQLVAYRNTMKNAKPLLDERRAEQEREVAEYEARMAAIQAENDRKIAAMKAEADRHIAAANDALRALNLRLVEAAMLSKMAGTRRRIVNRPDVLDRILRRISKATGIKVSEIKGDRRNVSVAFARHAFCYWAVRRTARSLPEIGRFIGGRDHTTVMHGRNVYVAKRRAQGRTLREVR